MVDLNLPDPLDPATDGTWGPPINAAINGLAGALADAGVGFTVEGAELVVELEGGGETRLPLPPGPRGNVGPAGGTDAATAEWVEDGPLTSAALSANYVQEGSAFADLGKQSGVDPTGATECAAAIQAALNSFASFGVRAYARGTFKISSTVTIADNADLGDATFNYIGAGVALRIGTATSGAFVTRLRVTCPKIIAINKTTPGWAQVTGSVGIEISNLLASVIEVPLIRSCETGLKVHGKGKGSVHNTVLIGHLDNNKVNQALTADATGWSNQNVYIGGQFSHNSAEGTSTVGVRHLEMAVCASPLNTNMWIGPSLEGNAAEFHAVIAGSYNVINSGRWEVTGGARLRWASDSTRNTIRDGYASESIVETFVAGAAGSNAIISTSRAYLARSAGAGGVAIWENSTSSTSPIDILMEAGARTAGASPVTGYAVSRSAASTRMKRAGDFFDRIVFDHVGGRAYFGDGTAAVAMYVGAVSTSGLGIYGANLYFGVDNTKDIGLAGSLRPRDLNLGRNAVIGGALDHDGTTVGFYGKTPVTQPAANPDTTGATLAALEAEVNELKALLRSVGLMA